MVSRKALMDFDADGVGVGNGNYFGFPFSVNDCELVLQSVPWDVTVSYGAGTSGAPKSIIDASIQVEIYDAEYHSAWKKGIATLNEIEFAAINNEKIRSLARQIIEDAETGGKLLLDTQKNELLFKINTASRKVNEKVYQQAKEQIIEGKIVGLIGGDHSTPLGLMQALNEVKEFGVLHIDAHCDLRNAYEGFEFSHASIMRNALKLNNISKLVQVGVRDFSLDELEFAKSEKRIVQFTDKQINENRFKGKTWHEQCFEIAAELPKNVYISFDIDGLQQQFCPATGTPVPGGLSYSEAVYMLNMLCKQGKTIVGFDLTEVANGSNGQWDSNVGARILYKLCNLALTTK